MEFKTENLQEVILSQAIKICELEKELIELRDSKIFWSKQYENKEHENKNLLDEIERLNNEMKKSNIIIGISRTDEL